MKALLTSSGIRNASIHAALVDLLGKPVAECDALFIPTAIYPFEGGPGMAWQAVTGQASAPLCGLGWKSLGHQQRLGARIVNYADGCAPRRREGPGTGPDSERHAA